MEWKTKLMATVPLMALAGSAMAAYSPTYAVADVQPGIVDIIAGLVIGIAGQAGTIGTAVGLTIAIGLLFGLVILVLKAVSSIRGSAHKISGGKD
jgi:hypothetical protein